MWSTVSLQLIKVMLVLWWIANANANVKTFSSHWCSVQNYEVAINYPVSLIYKGFSALLILTC